MSVGWDNIIARLPQDMRAAQPLNRFFNWLLYSTLACFVYVNLRTARLAADRMRAAELARALSRRRTLESRLQAMQARVEPQFLFNTLAQVRELYERDADVASRVLDDLIAYLRAALPHLRESSSTLGQEITLARAYLDIMRIRLGKRLTFSIDVPEATKAARMPPMMLLPLIDHALVYGLQPADSSGTIRITTEAAAGRLRLAITDSGVAFLPDTHADGLDSIAQRLHALYGDQARFELERMRERGTRATLEIPYEDTDSRDR
jgi:LytS/YehU family sensor histidine kinase